MKVKKSLKANQNLRNERTGTSLGRDVDTVSQKSLIIIINSHWEPSPANASGKDMLWDETSSTVATSRQLGNKLKEKENKILIHGKTATLSKTQKIYCKLESSSISTQLVAIRHTRCMASKMTQTKGKQVGNS